MIDLEALFVIKTSVLELIARSTLLYFGILLLMRLLPRRAGGELGFNICTPDSRSCDTFYGPL